MSTLSTQQERLDYLLDVLCREKSAKELTQDFALHPLQNMNLEEKHNLFRGLVNIRPPESISEEFLQVQDIYLQEYLKQVGICPSKNLEHVQENISIWQGDITLLEVDGIVNAANNQLLGCFIPSHACIDNFIHTYAGVQLRLDCHKIMQAQGHLEETGTAKITSAYNLPSKYVLHTVGPIIHAELTQKDCDLLADCYRSCLDIAHANGLQSIAFCCISTGVFRFPNKEAAQIAIETVKKYQEETNSNMHIIFNVFKDIDYELYKELLAS